MFTIEELCFIKEKIYKENEELAFNICNKIDSLLDYIEKEKLWERADSVWLTYMTKQTRN